MDEDLKRPMKVTVVIPCYNERDTLPTLITRLRAIEDDGVTLDIHIVDDGSTDGSPRIAQELSRKYDNVRATSLEVNQGKGAALRVGLRAAEGDFIAIQDADLEYDPGDLKRMIDFLRETDADVVVGSRFLNGDVRSDLNIWQSLGNRIITRLSNLLTGLKLTDIEVCYKVFRREALEGIELREDRFGIEPELIAKIARKRLRIYEIGISYTPRTRQEGKKIGIADGIRALYCVLSYNAYRAPILPQLVLFMLFGAIGILLDVSLFAFMRNAEVEISRSIVIAFLISASYQVCCVNPLLFRKGSRWKQALEPIVHGLGLIAAAVVDFSIFGILSGLGLPLEAAKSLAIFAALLGLYFHYRFLLFSPESGDLSGGTN